MKILKWLLITPLILLLIIIVALYNIPAKYIPDGLEYARQQGLIDKQTEDITLNNLSGTVWNGTAEQASVTIDGAELELGRLSWQLDWGSLIDQLPAVDIQTLADTHQSKARLIAQPNGDIIVRDAEGFFPIALLEPWLPRLVSGKLSFVVDHWAFNAKELLALDAVLNLEYADWLGGDYNMAIGSYMAQLSMQEKDVQIQINDFGAALGIDGLMTITPSQRYTFNALLQPRDGLAPEVATSLSWLGKAQANGDILINRRGRL
jgi:hypothetical protein